MIEECVIIEQEGGMPVVITSDTEGRIRWNMFGAEVDAHWFQEDIVPAIHKARYRVSKDLSYISAAPGSPSKRHALDLGGRAMPKSDRISRVKSFARKLARMQAWQRTTEKLRAIGEKASELNRRGFSINMFTDHGKDPQGRERSEG